ncbi:MAG: MBL fold metallo-hydrolase, partial [Clostridia bacterium]|nr:MBL fold metallo-hydrolase [Clostridia bacterium]
VVSNSELSINFLELGNANAGDSTLIKCGDTEVLIDAGSKRNSTETVKNYIDQYCTDGKLEYVIATHAHEDHIAALAGEEGKNNGVLYSYEIGTVIQFAGHKTNSKVYNDYCAAVSFAENRGAAVHTAKECWYQSKEGAQKTYYLDGDDKKISLNILYQKYYDSSTSNENNYSVCTLLSQEVNANTTYNYLFTGDLEKAGEESLVASNQLPHCTLFKGGHHGSSTSSNDVLLSEISPENIAICTCAGTYEYADKPSDTKPEAEARLNTFPTQEAIDRMSKYTTNIFVTTLGVLNEDYTTNRPESMNGNIVFYSTGGNIKRWCSNNDIVLKDTDWFKANRTWSGIKN